MSNSENRYWLKQFLIDMLERVVTTFAESLAGVIGAMNIATLGEIDWGFALGSAGLAALMSALKCLAAKKVGDCDNASLVK